MIIKLYKNNSENNKIDKDLSIKATINGTIREKTSIIDPIIILSDIDNIIFDCNYMYIPDFKRYYFIKNITSINKNLWEITLHVDVLSSFSSEIKSQTAVIKRQEYYYNLYLDDGIFKTYQNPNIITKIFPNGFNSQSFLLAIAGA